MNEIVIEFLQRYSREYEFYLALATLAAARCETLLKGRGIQAQVTFRAKKLDRLSVKLHQRHLCNAYSSLEDIYDDLVDLAGVRIALYFPGQSGDVKELIQTAFEIVRVKDFTPEGSRLPQGTYTRRFPGYLATHYRVRLPSQAGEDGRFSNSIVEIQVASVLMHGWSEVEHDLVYKPLSGELSDEEYSILDEVNGLVLAGELALERLQHAATRRLSQPRAKFNNHFELASHLFEHFASGHPEEEPEIGRADVLLAFLRKLERDRPADLAPYFDSLTTAVGSLPLVDQLLDLLIEGNKSNYQLLEEARATAGRGNPYSDLLERSYEEMVSDYMKRWSEIELDLRLRKPEANSLASLLEEIPPPLRHQIEPLRLLRNRIVHDDKVVQLDELKNGIQALSAFRLEFTGTGQSR